MPKFQFKPETINVFRNFAQINNSFIIKDTECVVRNGAKNAVAIHRYAEPLDFGDTKEFGLYQSNDFLSILAAYKTPDIEVNEKFLTISEAKSKVKFFTTILDMIPFNHKPAINYNKETKTYSVEDKFGKVDTELLFNIPQEKITILQKMVSLLKSDFIFFESVDGAVRITVGNELESSATSWELVIDTDITRNELPKAVKISTDIFTIVPADYTISIASVGISRWRSNSNVDYYLAIATN